VCFITKKMEYKHPFPGKRHLDSHKGDYGHFFIIGGSPGLTGAVCLAALAGARSGCGLVTAGIPKGLNEIIEIKLTEIMSLPLPDTQENFISRQAVNTAKNFINEKADAVVIGPGISTNEETKEFVKTLIPQIKKPLLIDADAIKIISEEKNILKNLSRPVLTPHPGEMSFLTGLSIDEIQGNREETAEKFARENNVILVLKGYRTVITDGKNTYINLTGNPGMAAGGSGDVLSGIIGSFLAQGAESLQASKTATYIHGLAGDLAAREKGEISLLPSDIIENLPLAFQYLSPDQVRRTWSGEIG
jgi:ADP-dependent NAD(P)H-hydrate dehydratase / NAD(P)H-hydrate epimerase